MPTSLADGRFSFSTFLSAVCIHQIKQSVAGRSEYDKSASAADGHVNKAHGMPSLSGSAGEEEIALFLQVQLLQSCEACLTAILISI